MISLLSISIAINSFFSLFLFKRNTGDDAIIKIIVLVVVLIIIAIGAATRDSQSKKKSSYSKYSSAPVYNIPNPTSYAPAPEVPEEHFEISLLEEGNSYTQIDKENKVELSRDELMSGINRQVGKSGICNLNYKLSEPENEAYQKLLRLFDEMKKSQMIWVIESSIENPSRKLHSNAAKIISRRTTSITYDAHPFIKTNLRVATVDLVSKKIVFLPDGILVFHGKFYILWNYDKYKFSITFNRFIEDGFCPSDAKTVDHTWKHSNKDGTPDQRFSSNPRIPIVIYPEFQVYGDDGVKLHLQLANSSLTTEEWSGNKQSSQPPPKDDRNAPLFKSDLEAAREILGVSQGASEEEIKTAFHKKSVMYHPDKVTHMAPEFRELAERKMKEINAAYAVLKKGKTESIPTVVPNKPKVSKSDEFYYKAVAIVTDMGRGSTSVLQRRLNIGYGKAAELLNQMEQDGFIGPAEGSKPRQVLKKAYDFRSEIDF